MISDKPTILVIDDAPANLLIIEDLLGDLYQLHTCDSGEEGLVYLASSKVDLILLDVVMNGIDGFEVCRRLKADPATQDIPILFISGLESAADETYGLSLGAEDFIHKPFSPPVVLARVRNHLQLANARRELKLRNEDLEAKVEARTREIVQQSQELVRRTQEVMEVQDATISAFCALAETRDNETGNHIRRTQHYVKALAEHVCEHPRFRDELTDENIHLMYKSAPLHDIGKVAIPDSILRKPGKLTPEEWVVMRRHPVYGVEAINQTASQVHESSRHFLKYAREIANFHHERWDGKGYPQGLSGEAIPLSARLMAVADVYDALISRRSYKPPYTHQEALLIIREQHEGQFDPELLAAMFEIADTFDEIARRFSD